MPLITLEKASLAFGHHPLLDSADLVLEPGERVGLIGRNGAGKSSLIKVLSKTALPDDGKVWHSPGLKIAHVAQEPEFAGENTVFEEVSKGLGGIREALLEYHHLSEEISHNHSDALLEKLHALQVKLEAEGGWHIESRIEAAIARLGLPAESPISALSGGQKKRVALAQALVSEPDILFLDEPTNHLDVASIEWLEGLLCAYPGAVFFITHDRMFLDHVATRIVELDRGRLASFQGNFSYYQAKKTEMLEAQETEARKFDKFLAQEEVWIRKGVEARRTRNEGRVRRLEALRIERAKRREKVGSVNFSLDEGEKSGKLVAELAHVSKSYSGRKLIDDFSARIMRGDKIGIIGPNGAGKSTLLKLILGEIAPDEGKVRLGTKMEVAYFDQLREKLDLDATLVDTISQGGDFIEIGSEKKHAISYLSDFLFPPERARAKVGSLSGGERNRLLLARLFTRPVNVLVLDEPTNDLDIETLELLESLLLDYSGTLFLVSHDRSFLDNVVTQVIASEGDGVWREYVGGYSDWLRQKPAIGAKPKATAAMKKSAPVQKRALSYKEEKELAGLPMKMESLEKEQKELAMKLSDPALYADYTEAEALQKRFSAIEDELLSLLQRWEELEAKSG